MAGLSYYVEVVLNTKGNVDSGLGRTHQAAGKLSSAFSKLGSEALSTGGKIAGMYTGAVERAGGVAATLGKVGAAGLLAGATYGVAQLNSGLETAQISIAAVLSAQGEVGNVGAGMDKAGSLIEKMRKDAQQLPGEFEDLFGIFQTGIGAAGQAGLNSIQFEDMSANAMAAGKALAVPLDQAARELALLLEGRAGSHNAFGNRLGIKAQGFNELGAADRVKVITKELAKFQPAIRVFGTSFDALFSTAIDNVKSFGLKATSPLFGRIKNALTDINNWFDNNQSTVSAYAARLGRFLADAFDTGKRFVLEWWPAISTFAENAYARITAIWRDAGPLAERVGAAFKSFLENPKAIDKIIRALELYAAIKIGGSAVSMFGGLASAGANVAMLTGGGAAAGGAGALGSAASATGVGAVAIAAAAANTLAFSAGQEVAARERNVRALDIFTANTAPVGFALGALTADFKVNSEGSRALYQAKLKEGNGVDLLTASNNAYYIVLGETIDVVKAYSSIHYDAMIAVGGFAARVAGFQFTKDEALNPTVDEPVQFDRMGRHPLDAYNDVAMDLAKAQVAADAAKEGSRPKGPGKGSGNVTVNVQMTISSNQSPGQIARKAVDFIMDKARHPTQSRFAPSFSDSARS